MNNLDISALGLREIDGADVLGGEMAALPALATALIVCATGYLIANWSDFKAGFSDGYNGR